MWADNNETNGTTYQWLDGTKDIGDYAKIVFELKLNCYNDINGSAESVMES